MYPKSGIILVCLLCLYFCHQSMKDVIINNFRDFSSKSICNMPQTLFTTYYALRRHSGHHRLCEHSCSLLISEWSHADRHSPGSPSPLTGLRLWQDAVTGGWPGIVYGCALLSPCDHARLLVVLWIYYLIYCSYDCALVMMNILKAWYGWDVPQKLVSFLAEILLPLSPFVDILFSSNICNN